MRCSSCTAGGGVHGFRAIGVGVQHGGFIRGVPIFQQGFLQKIILILFAWMGKIQRGRALSGHVGGTDEERHMMCVRHKHKVIYQV